MGNEQINFRYNIIIILIYIIGIMLIGQLFNLQILKGDTYREQSNTRLSRVTSMQSARGSIVDRTGNELNRIQCRNIQNEHSK